MSEIPGSLKPEEKKYDSGSYLNATDTPYRPSGYNYWNRMWEEEETKYERKKDKWTLPRVWFDNVQHFVDEENLEIIECWNPNRVIGFFTSLEEMHEFLLEGHHDMTIEDLYAHRYSNYTPYKYEPPVPVPLEEKLKHKVFEYGDYVVLKLPEDMEFIKKEGQQMQHCLNGAHWDYCRRMKSGEIEVYSLTDTRDNDPGVTVEVALTRSSYSGPVLRPTVTQLRGKKNECPPKDQFIKPLYEFFKTQRWHVGGHGIWNFDRKYDGDLFIRRYRELHSPPRSLPSILGSLRKKFRIFSL